MGWRDAETVALGPRSEPEAVKQWVEADDADALKRGAALSAERRVERQQQAAAKRAEREAQREAEREAAEAVR